MSVRFDKHSRRRLDSTPHDQGEHQGAGNDARPAQERGGHAEQRVRHAARDRADDAAQRRQALLGAQGGAAISDSHPATTNAFSVGVLRLWPTVTRRSGSTRPMRSCTAGNSTRPRDSATSPMRRHVAPPTRAATGRTRPPWTTTAAMPTMANTAPIAPSPKPRRWCANNGNVASKAPKGRHEQHGHGAGDGDGSGGPCAGGPRSGQVGCGSCPVPPPVASGRRRSATTALTPAMAAATKNGETGAAEGGQATDGWPQDEPDAVGGAEEPEQAHAVLWSHEVGGRRLCHRHAPSRRAVEDVGDEEEPERARHPGEETGGGRPRQRHDEQWLATDAVGQSPRSNGALANCAAENAASRSPTEPGPAAERCVEREERDDDAEADQVDCDRGPQDPEPRRQPAARGLEAEERGVP